MIEYKVVHLQIFEETIEDQLNKLGAEGWELCWYNQEYGNAVFKRKKVGPPEVMD